VKSLLASALVVAAMWLFCGPVLGLGWHLLHHDSITYLGFTIAIPKHSYVTCPSAGPIIWTLSLGAPFPNRPYGRIGLHKSTGPFFKQKHYQAFVEAMSRDAGNSGHQLKSSQTVELGGRSAFCLEFECDKKQPLLIMDRAIEGSDIFVSYAGDPRYLPDVFNMLHNRFPAPLPARS
jgi:hypothetical protein